MPQSWYGGTRGNGSASWTAGTARHPRAAPACAPSGAGRDADGQGRGRPPRPGAAAGRAGPAAARVPGCGARGREPGGRAAGGPAGGGGARGLAVTRPHVLDASALLAVLNQEAGAEQVLPLLSGALMSAV